MSGYRCGLHRAPTLEALAEQMGGPGAELASMDPAHPWPEPGHGTRMMLLVGRSHPGGPFRVRREVFVGADLVCPHCEGPLDWRYESFDDEIEKNPYCATCGAV